jgi:hypothetical protein
MNKKKKTVNQHPVQKQPASPPQRKTDVDRKKKKEEPKPDTTTEKNMLAPQPAINTPKQKVVNEQEENQVVNDVEESDDLSEK